MRRLPQYCAAAAMCLVALTLVASAQQHTGSVTIDPTAIATKSLLKCRESANETLTQVRCYEEAVIAMPQNFSHWSSLALLYTRADMGIQAHEAMNHSTNEWLKYITPKLEAAGKNLTAEQMRWIDVLRFHYDLGKPAEDGTDNKKWLREEAVEMGFLLAKKFEIEHAPTDAHSIYYEFLLQTGTGEAQAMDFHRRTGNILALTLTGPQNDSSVVFRIAEGVQPAVDGLIEHIMSKGAGPFDPPLKRMCGIDFTDGKELKVVDIIANIDECVKRWGNLSDTLEQEDAAAASGSAPAALNQWSGSMRETSMHRLAVAGATGTIKTILDHYEGQTVRGDRFGRGMMHYAAAWGREATLKLLLDMDGNVDHADAGGLKPRHLGCDSPGFRTSFEAVVGDKKACDGFARDKVTDEAEITDDSGTDGGWNPRFKRPKYLHCDFDVRDAARMTQSDLIAAYTQSNQPVVLRNSFYETDGPDYQWGRKKFARAFGGMLVRQEFFPRQSRWGIGGIVNVSNVTEWLATADVNDGKVATVNVDLPNHPLYELADQWVPPTFSNKKRHDEIDFFDPKVTISTVNLNKRGSKSNHHVRAQSVYHTVVYGHEEWSLLPPRYARTLRDVLPQTLTPFAQRCELVTGDVLIVPDLWSASWISKSNGIAMERYLYKKARSGQ